LSGNIIGTSELSTRDADNVGVNIDLWFILLIGALLILVGMDIDSRAYFLINLSFY
jgi:hypothetical protein